MSEAHDPRHDEDKLDQPVMDERVYLGDGSYIALDGPATVKRGIRLLIAALVGCILGAAIWIGLIERGNRMRNEQLQHVTYRLCARNSVDRAFAQTAVGRNNPVELLHMRVAWTDRNGLHHAKLPILDCLPNLVGDPAKPMSLSAQKDFVLRYQKGELTEFEMGICDRPPNEAAC